MAIRVNDVWRLPQIIEVDDLRSGGSAGTSKRPTLFQPTKDRLRRIVSRAFEFMVKVTGRARGGSVELKAHLDFITRNAKLAAETQEGTPRQALAVELRQVLKRQNRAEGAKDKSIMV